MNPHRTRKPIDEFDDTPIKYPSKLPPNSDGKNPNVIIVGTGLGGLLLAILLDKAGIPYEIYERSSSVRPLGTGEDKLHDVIVYLFSSLRGSFPLFRG